MTTNKKMGRDELERHGQQLFGYGWKSSLAEHLDANRKTVSRWIAADAVPEWAAEAIRAMVSIAPPPGTTEQDDRDDICYDAIQPKLLALVDAAENVGWNRGEVLAAVLSAALGDIMARVGRDEVIQILDQARAQVPDRLS